MANLHVIRDLCERKNLTIRELAKRIDRDESTIQSAIRRGSTNSTTLEDIARVLNVPVGIFFDGFAPDNSESQTREIEHLRQLLAEKERLIEVLLSDRKKA